MAFDDYLEPGIGDAQVCPSTIPPQLILNHLLVSLSDPIGQAKSWLETAISFCSLVANGETRLSHVSAVIRPRYRANPRSPSQMRKVYKYVARYSNLRAILTSGSVLARRWLLNEIQGIEGARRQRLEQAHRI